MFRAIRVLLARRLRFLPPRVFAIAAHLLFHGEPTTLRRPRGFAQMLAARNLREQPDLVRRTTDKVDVRAHVAARIGPEHLVELFQVVERAEDLDLDALAARGVPYVLKAAHGCAMTLLVPDPAAADRDAIRATVARWLDTDFFRAGWRETAYRGLPRRVVAERMIGDGRPPADHKFYVVHGEPVMLAVDTDRFTAHRSTLLSPDWEPMAVTGWFDAADELPERPPSFPEMLAIARELGRDFDLVRVDLYDDGGHVLFGELTHHPGGGLMRLRPRAFDRALGDLWRDGTPIPERFLRRT